MLLLLLFLSLSVVLLDLQQLLVEVLDALLHLGLVLFLDTGVEGVEGLEEGDHDVSDRLGVHVGVLLRTQDAKALLDKAGHHRRSHLFLVLHTHLHLLQTRHQLHNPRVGALFLVTDLYADLFRCLCLSLLLLLRTLFVYSQPVRLPVLRTWLIRK